MKVSRLISEAINIEMELDEKILLFGIFPKYNDLVKSKKYLDFKIL